MTTQHTDDACDMATILSLSLHVLLFPSLNESQFVVLTAFDPVMYDHSRGTEHCSTIRHVALHYHQVRWCWFIIVITVVGNEQRGRNTRHYSKRELNIERKTQDAIYNDALVSHDLVLVMYHLPLYRAV